MAENQSSKDKREQDKTNPFASLFSGANGGGFFAQLMTLFTSLFSSGLGGLGKLFSFGSENNDGQNILQRGSAAIGRGIDSGRELVGRGVDALKNLIGHHESGNDYNRVYGAGVKRIAVTDMSVNEVLAWQRDYVKNGSPSSAIGKYQIVQDTLRGLKTEMGLTGNEKMDGALQERMFMHLANRRGLSDYLSGKITQERMMLNLSQEWASLPKNDSGRSYYHGDGLNRASAAPASVRRALDLAVTTTVAAPTIASNANNNVRYTEAERTGQSLSTTPRISSQLNQSAAPVVASAPAPYMPTITPTETTAPAPQRPQVALMSPSFAFS